MSPEEAWVSSGLRRGQGLWLQQTQDTQHVALALLEEVAASPTAEPLSRTLTDCRTIIPKNSHMVKKVLGPTTWGSGKGTKNPLGI